VDGVSVADRWSESVNKYTSGLLEKILEPSNMNLAYKRVKANKGSHGVDGMTQNELGDGSLTLFYIEGGFARSRLASTN